MFDLAWSELLLVAVLAIVFIGPKDLPRVMRTAGQYMAKMRAMAREFQNTFEDLARESELDELRKQVAELRSDTMKPLENMQAAIDAASVSPAELSKVGAPAEPTKELTSSEANVPHESDAPKGSGAA